MSADQPEGRDDPPETPPGPDGPQPPAAEQRATGLSVETDPKAGSVVVKDQVPDTMFVFPLRTAVPFPNLMMPLLLDSPNARDIVAKAEAHNGFLFLVLQKYFVRALTEGAVKH